MNERRDKPPAPHLRRGRIAEDIACRHLQRHGLRLVVRNYRSKGGEIDLIMRDTDSLVFVEVRYRASSRYGSAAETVLATGKIRRLRNSAEDFLQRNRRLRELYSRFDVIGITGSLNAPGIDWIKDAF